MEEPEIPLKMSNLDALILHIFSRSLSCTRNLFRPIHVLDSREEIINFSRIYRSALSLLSDDDDVKLKLAALELKWKL